MGLFGKGKTFKIYGLDDCKIVINGMNILPFVEEKKVSTLEYDGSDIYANDHCISRFLRDSSSYNVRLESPQPAPKAEKAEKTTSKTAKPATPKIDLYKKAEEAVKEMPAEAPFTLENLNIVIQGNVDSIESEGDLSVSAHSVNSISCEGKCTIDSDTIEGDIECSDDLTITGNIEGSVSSEGNLNITGNVTGGDVNSEGDITISGSATASGDISLDGDLTVNGNISKCSSISVGNDVTIGGNQSGDMEVEGDVIIKGDFKGKTLNADGGVSFNK